MPVYRETPLVSVRCRNILSTYREEDAACRGEVADSLWGAPRTPPARSDRGYVISRETTLSEVVVKDSLHVHISLRVSARQISVDTLPVTQYLGSA